MSLDRHIFMLKYGHEKDYDSHVRGALFHIKNSPSMDYDELIGLHFRLNETKHRTTGIRSLMKNVENLIDSHPDNNDE